MSGTDTKTESLQDLSHRLQLVEDALRFDVKLGKRFYERDKRWFCYRTGLFLIVTIVGTALFGIYAAYVFVDTCITFFQQQKYPLIRYEADILVHDLPMPALYNCVEISSDCRGRTNRTAEGEAPTTEGWVNFHNEDHIFDNLLDPWPKTDDSFYHDLVYETDPDYFVTCYVVNPLQNNYFPNSTFEWVVQTKLAGDRDCISAFHAQFGIFALKHHDADLRYELGDPDAVLTMANVGSVLPTLADMLHPQGYARVGIASQNYMIISESQTEVLSTADGIAVTEYTYSFKTDGFHDTSFALNCTMDGSMPSGEFCTTEYFTSVYKDPRLQRFIQHRTVSWSDPFTKALAAIGGAKITATLVLLINFVLTCIHQRQELVLRREMEEKKKEGKKDSVLDGMKPPEEEEEEGTKTSVELQDAVVVDEEEEEEEGEVVYVYEDDSEVLEEFEEVEEEEESTSDDG